MLEVNKMEELFRSYVDFHMGLFYSCNLVDICQRHNISYDKNSLHNYYVEEELSKN